MDDTVENLIKKLKRLPGFIKDVVDNSIQSNKDEILDLNKSQMLVAGVDSEGRSLGDYSPKSIEERKKRGLQTEHIDLRFTGKFQDGMKLKKVKKGEYEITSTDPKWNGNTLDRSLSEQWPDALGLTENSEEILTKELISDIEFQVNNYLSTAKTIAVPSNV